MYLDVYERDTSKYMHDTCTIHAGYMQDTWDTYRIGNYTKTYRKPHVTRGAWAMAWAPPARTRAWPWARVSMARDMSLSCLVRCVVVSTLVDSCGASSICSYLSRF